MFQLENVDQVLATLRQQVTALRVIAVHIFQKCSRPNHRRPPPGTHVDAIVALKFSRIVRLQNRVAVRGALGIDGGIIIYPMVDATYKNQPVSAA